MPYKTTDGMKADAQRGLDWRSEFGRGGTEIGIARARDIVNDRNLSEDTVQRMFSFFSRHEVDKQAEGFRQGEKGYPSNGRIAWALWGGDAGFTWSKNIMDSLNEERTMQDIDNSDTITENVRNDAMENEEVTAEEVEAVAAETEIVAEETERFSRDTMSTRAMGAEDAVINADTRRVKIAVSSEAPVERSFGTEILDHKASSIDLSFLNSGRAPLLLDHDPTQQIGVVESVDLDGSARRLRATVRFGKNGLAKDVFDDVADGIRANISVGYQINKLDKEGREVYRATSWTPMEVSVVSIPADRTVGVGRSAVDNLDTQPTSIQITKEFPMEHQVDMEAVKAEAARSAAKDTAEIFRLASKHNKREMAEKAVSEGKSLAQFRGELLEVIGNAPLEAQDLGLTKKEVRNFSLMRAIRAMANPTDRNAQRDAAFEFEASAAAQAVYGREARGLMIPTDVLRQWAKRDINTSDDGGLVAEDFRGGDFVDVLRNASSVMAAGATMLTGLSGNVAIPKKSAASAGGWISSEGGASSESEPTFGQITMTPRTVGAFTDITRLMMMQSSLDIENLIRNDLSTALALAIDLGALAGSGSSGQPTGIKNTSGINAPTAFAGAVPTFAEVVAMETAVAEDNALLGNLAYILPASMYGALKTTTKDSGSGQFVVAPDGSMNGYNAIVSNQVTSGDLYFGNFADCLIGMYGGLDITVDPYTASSSGTVRIVALQTADVAVRHAVSFAFNNDE
jgi:HK97 family phage major capsid protein/HK97 family phage prohead protease